MIEEKYLKDLIKDIEEVVVRDCKKH